MTNPARMFARILAFAAFGLCISGHPNCSAQPPSDRGEQLRNEAKKMIADGGEMLDLIRLVQIDLELSDDSSEANHDACREILKTLAMSQNATALEYVRSVFENEPERRGTAAWALSQSTSLHPTELQDWRYMVRSLTVVRGDEAVSVMSALQRFRPRANKPQWVRHVILIGLQLAPDQQAAAIGLLQHWTGVPKKSAKVPWTLNDYQAWFAKEHPDQPEAVLPVDVAGRRWTMANLEFEIQDVHAAPELVEAGLVAFQKAGCQKCHRRGQVGETFGPDLTSLGWRRQKNEILRALLYPSLDLDEEYPTVTVALKDGRSLSGVMSGGSADTLSLVSSTAVKEQFLRTDIEQIVNQKISNMPEGTLESLTLDEVKAMFAYLISVDGVAKPHGDELQ